MLLLLLFSTGCDLAPSGSAAPVPRIAIANSNVLRIYSSLPVKGHDAAQATQIRQAIDLALALRATHTGAWRVEHVALDGGEAESGDWSPEVERDNAQLAASDPASIAYIGPYTSGATGISLPITNRAHLLQLGISATWPGLTLSGWNPGEPEKYYPDAPRNYARLSIPDSRQADAAAQWAARQGIRSAIVLDDGSSYSTGLAAEFVRAATTNSIQVISSVHLHTGTPADLRVSLPGEGADGLFYAASTSDLAARVAEALAGRGSTTKVFTTDTALGDLFEQQAGAGAADWYFTSNSGSTPPDSPEWVDFKTRFQSKYGQTPGRAAANAFDLTNLVLSTAAKAGRDRDTIRAAVLKTRGVRGVSGLISFDDAGDAVEWSIDGYRLQGGRFTFADTFTGSASR